LKSSLTNRGASRGNPGGDASGGRAWSSAQATSVSNQRSLIATHVNVELMALLEKLLAKPPGYLSELEALIGPLLMNIDDHEGMGHIYRPAYEDSLALCLEQDGVRFRLCAAEPRRLGGGAEVTVEDGRAMFEGRALVVGDVIEVAGRSYRFVTEELHRDRFSAEVRSVSVSSHWDMYHEHPDRYRNPSIKEYQLEIAVERAAAEAALAARAKPRVVVDDKTRWIVYEPFYLREDSRADEITLRWFAERPEFAYAKPEGSVRERFVSELAALLRRGGKLAEVTAFFEERPPEVGVEVSGTLNRDDYQFSFRPPVDVLELARALGLERPHSISTDVHMSCWMLRAAPPKPDDWPEAPRLGPWVFDAQLERWPKLVDDSAGKHPRSYDLEKCVPNRVTYCRIYPPR
jgi:hypothetical protein